MAEKVVKTPESSGDVVKVVGDQVYPLAELRSLLGDKPLAAAWARGEIEFGRRTRIVTGNPTLKIGPEGQPGKLTREGESPAGLVVEDGFEWSGPKTTKHRPFDAVVAEQELPHCPRYRKYERRKNDLNEEYSAPVKIDREEAVALCAYKVRLTDKGLSQITA